MQKMEPPRPPLEQLLRQAEGVPSALLPRHRSACNELLDTLLPESVYGGAGELGAVFVRPVGHGKSRTCVAVAAAASVCMRIPLRTIVLIPTILENTWRSEIAALLPHARVELYKGDTNIKTEAGWQRYCERMANANILLVSHRVFVSSQRHRRSLLWGSSAWVFPLIILDEAHSMRNPDGALHAAVRKVREEGALAPDGRMLLTTASPYINGPEDCCSLLSAASDDWRPMRGVAAMRVMFHRYMNRDTASDWMPQLDHRVIHTDVPMTEAEVAAYNVSVSQYVMQYEQSRAHPRGRTGVRGSLTRLRQRLEAPGIEGVLGAKLKQLVAIANDLGAKERLIVFCIYTHTPTDVVNAFAHESALHNRRVSVINGATPRTSRARILNEWANGRGGVLCAQLFVCGLGTAIL